MRARASLTVTLATAVLLALAAAPADAQGKGKGKKDRDRSYAEQVYDGGFLDGVWYPGGEGRYESRRGNGSGKVPPGWCKGRGNPHNTPQNCGYGGVFGRSDRRYDGRYDDRYGRGGSYDAEHADFHRYLDHKYSDLARQRPMTDIGWQLRIRDEKRREHQAWHARAGVRH